MAFGRPVGFDLMASFLSLRDGLPHSVPHLLINTDFGFFSLKFFCGEVAGFMPNSQPGQDQGIALYLT